MFYINNNIYRKVDDTMKILIINGTDYKKNTYFIAKQLVSKLPCQKTDIKEIVLPRDLPEHCAGCGVCFRQDISLCPHRETTKRLQQMLDKADVLIFVSPTYVYHSTGAMMDFLDHFCSIWLLHKPMKSMFQKQAVVISTSAGKGHKSAIKDVVDSLQYWGIPRIYTLGISLKAEAINKTSPKKIKYIYNSTSKIANKIKNRYGNVTPSPHAKYLFKTIRALIRHVDMQPTDKEYWKKQGWLYKTNPWKHERPVCIEKQDFKYR